jgi:hypothetical protein
MSSPAEQITALVQAFQEQPPDTVAPCKKNKVHTIDLTVIWKDDSTPVRMTDIEIHRGKATYVDDSIVKGKHKEKNVPPGTYRVFFPEIDASEIEQG